MGPLLTVALHTIVIYGFLILALRFLGRRHLGQLTVLDLVIIIVLGSAVETSMIAGNTSLAAGIVSAAVLLAANRALNAMMLRSKRLRHLLVGGPVLVVAHGRILEDRCRRAGFTDEDVMEALRERDAGRVEDVRYAVLETDGSVHVVMNSGASGGGKKPGSKAS